MFGEDIENIEPEKKYEESIAERVKTRRQNTQRTFALSCPPKKKKIILQKLLII